jgi:hypothetical protein
MEPTDQRISALEAKIEALKEVVGDLVFAITRAENFDALRTQSRSLLDEWRERFET